MISLKLALSPLLLLCVSRTRVTPPTLSARDVSERERRGSWLRIDSLLLLAQTTEQVSRVIGHN